MAKENGGINKRDKATGTKCLKIEFTLFKKLEKDSENTLSLCPLMSVPYFYPIFPTTSSFSLKNQVSSGLIKHPFCI
jgi:hypothetical protein